MRVKHPVYGEGLVRNSRLEYGDETVEVYFEGLGLKALVASMSSLEILEGGSG
jgi:DNA helicase-2/ATP-dependent DNA helicase PcrA